MIERYTLKFGPAYSQKEPEKALNDGIDPPSIPNPHKMKARIEFIGDLDDVKRMKDFQKQYAK